jgi:glucosamine-6-phosphate deaminase
MIVQRFEDEDALSAALATHLLEVIVARPALVLGLPTGRTPLGLYRELRERSGGPLTSSGPSRAKSRDGSRIDWSGVRTFNLDEFAGLEPSHEASYRAYMQAELFDHVSIDPANIGFLDGAASDLRGECRRYDEAIAAAGGIDLQLLGIGANGHIGFNEPADGLCAETHVAVLTRETREANAQRFAGDWSRVPERALSMGMATILNAREIVLMATGPEKADAVQDMIEGLITTQLPASLLQVHARVTVMLDRAAAARLTTI